MRWKLYPALVLLSLVLTFVLQNAATVHFNFLFWTFGLPGALLLLAVFLCGVATGLLWVAGRSARGKPHETQRKTQHGSKAERKENEDG